MWCVGTEIKEKKKGKKAVIKFYKLMAIPVLMYDN
jgi:hypothetical protein